MPGGQIWYQVFGAGDGTPILLLHGGPGAGHDYLEPLAALAVDRPVVFYDQQMHLFENCAHLAHVEETELYLRVVREFLTQVARRV